MFRMWYAGDDSGTGTYRIGYGISTDGVNWTKPKLGLVDYGGSLNNNVVLDLNASDQDENTSLIPGTVIGEPAIYRMWYSCMGAKWAICYASSPDGLRWFRYPLNPVLKPGGAIQGYLSPAVARVGSGFAMRFAALNGQGHYELRSATSPNGVTWTVDVPLKPTGLGEAGSWYDGGTVPGMLQASPGEWRLWYAGLHGSTQSIGFSTSTDGYSWVGTPLNPVISPGVPGSWDSVSVSRPSAVKDGPRYIAWFAGFDGRRWSIGTAATAFGERIAPPKTNPVVPLGNLEDWDRGGMFRPSVLFKDGVYRMWYTGSTKANGSTGSAIGYATSPDGVNWDKPLRNPVLEKSASGWDSDWVGFAWVTWDDVSSAFRMWYTGANGTSLQIGLATSSDGISWQKNSSNPALLIGNLTWFNPLDVRCPWVGKAEDRQVMYAGTGNGSRVSIARLSSWDGGLTWASDPEPFLTPMSGTWEGSSVSCPVLLTNQTRERQWLWYEGSEDLSVVGFGGIGHVVSDDFGTTFTRPVAAPVLAGTRRWDQGGIGGPSALLAGSEVRLWFHGGDYSYTRIGTAISSDGVHWHESYADPAVPPPDSDPADWPGVSAPVLFEDAGYTYLYFAAKENGKWAARYSSLLNGTELQGSFGVTISGSAPGGWDEKGRKPLAILKDGPTSHLWYAGLDGSGRWSIGRATWELSNMWEADPLNPILTAGASTSWDCEGIDGASILSPGLTYPYEMFYSGFDGTGWKIGFAHSDDGVNWTKARDNPVIYPSFGSSWDSVAVSSPRVIVEGGLYHAFYAGYDGEVWSLGHAFSANGVNWIKSRTNPILGGKTVMRDPADVRDIEVQRDGSGYRIWFSDSNLQNSAMTYAESPFLSVGTLISNVVDSGVSGTNWQNVTVVSRAAPTSRIGIALRTGVQPPIGAEWSPDRLSSPVHVLLDRWRYLQYRLTLVSLTGEISSVVEEVSGEYDFNHGPMAYTVSPESGGCTPDYRPTFSWDYADAESDQQSGFDLEVSNVSDFSQVYYSVSIPIELTSYQPTYALAEGIYFWRIQARDVYGKAGPWSGASEFCVDRKPPVTSLDFAGPHVGSTPTYIATGTRIWLNMSDPGCGRGMTLASVDGSGLQPQTGPITLPPGPHSIEFYSIDEAGNTETGRSRAIWVDAAAPVTSLSVMGANQTVSGVLYLRSNTLIILDPFDAESGTDAPSYSIDSASDWTPGPFVQPLPLGPHTLYYRSIDRVGNVEAIQSRSLFVDDDGPATSLTITGPHVQGTPVLATPQTMFNLTSADGGVGLREIDYSVSGGPEVRYAGNFSISGEGQHTLVYYAKDILMNAERQHVLLVQIDSQGPATTLVAMGASYSVPPDMYIGSATALMLTGSDYGSGLQEIDFRVDGGSWIRYSSPFNISQQGPHTLSFFGVDLLGNTESAKTLNVYVDDQPPSTRMTLVGLTVQSGGLTYVDESTTAVLDATDTGSGILFTRYRLDGGAWVIYSRPITFADPGQHAIEVQAMDNLGTAEPSQMFIVVVDASPPKASAGNDVALFAPALVTLDGSDSSDDTVIVQYEWIAQQNGTVVLNAAKGTIQIGTPGEYTFTLRVRDPLGRESSDSLTVKVLKDPDFDKDTLPDVWETEKYGNLTYGPNDDPDGDGVTNIEDYGRDGGADNQGGPGAATTGAQDTRTSDTFMLLVLAFLGVLAGTTVLQSLKIRELKRKLENREAERSVELDEDEEVKER